MLLKPLSSAAYDVVVVPKEPKGAPSITEPGGFTVKAPEIEEVAPGSGRPLDEITIKGRFFGLKKGKVYLEGSGQTKRCKVSSWTMEEIRFQVPKHFPAGSYTLRVTNKVGSGTTSFEVIQ